MISIKTKLSGPKIVIFISNFENNVLCRVRIVFLGFLPLKPRNYEIKFYYTKFGLKTKFCLVDAFILGIFPNFF
jgi:hypothetical protein